MAKVIYQRNLFDEQTADDAVIITAAADYHDVLRGLNLPLDGSYYFIESDTRNEYPACGNLQLSDTFIKVIRLPAGTSSSWTQVFLGAVLSVVGIWYPPLLYAGLAILGSGFVSMIPDKPNNPNAGDPSKLKNNYTIQNGKNQSAIGNNVPVVFGTHNMVPPYVGNYYTTLGSNTAGDTKSYLTVCFCTGYKDTEITDIKLGNTQFAKNANKVMNGAIPVTGSFVGAVEVRQGSIPSLYGFKRKEQQINAEMEYYTSSADFINTRTTMHKTDRIFVTVVFNGLFRLNDNGDRVSQSVGVRIAIRSADGTSVPWKTALSKTYSSNKNVQLRYGETIILSDEDKAANPSGEWEVMVYRYTQKSEDSKIQDKAYWGILQSQATTVPIMDAEFAQKLTLIAVQFEASEATQGILDELSCTCRRKVPVWNGTDFSTIDYSNNPASAYMSLLKDFYPAPVTNDRIDIAALGALADWADDNGIECNALVASEEPARDTINAILSTSQATFYLKNGVYSLSHDVLKQQPVAVLTPKNTSGFAGSKTFSNKIDYATATFEDAARDWQAVTEDIYPVNYNAAALGNKGEISLFGCTSYDQAVKTTRYMLACSALRPENYNITVGIEHYAIPHGERVLVAHDVLVVSLANGRVVGTGYDSDLNRDFIILDEYVPQGDNDKLYSIQVFKQDGNIYTIPVDPPLAALQRLYVAVGAAADIAAGDLYAYGESDRESLDCIVIGKTVGENGDCELQLTAYNEAIQNALTDPIPPYNPKITSKDQASFDIVADNFNDVSTINCADRGIVNFDFSEFNTFDDPDHTPSFYYGNLGTMGDDSRLYTATGTVTKEWSEPRAMFLDWLETDGTQGGGFACDTYPFKNATISMMLDIDPTINDGKVIMEYRDDANNNMFKLYIRDGGMWVSRQNVEKQIVDWDFTNPHMLTIVRDWDYMTLTIYQDNQFLMTTSFEWRIEALESEDEIFGFISETDPTIGIGSETQQDPPSGFDRNTLCYLFMDSDGANGIIGKFAKFHMYDYVLDINEVMGLWDNDLLSRRVSYLTNYIGAFYSVPDNPKVGDSFRWLNNTNNYFVQGKYYWLTKDGWSIISGEYLKG